MKNTGFTSAQKMLIAARDLGCVIHSGNYDPEAGRCEGGLVAHHRKGRGHGGVKSRNRVANGLLICGAANSAMESDPVFAEYARSRGWKLRTDYEIEMAPVWVPRLQRFVYLNDAAEYSLHPYGAGVI